MAYGKDRAVLAQAGSFRQRASSYNTKRQESRPRGGGGSLYFIDQYKPPQEEPSLIRLIDGHFKVKEPRGEGKDITVQEVELPFWPFIKHYDGRNERAAFCSGGPLYMVKDKREPCHGCDIHWTTRETKADGKRKSERMSIQEMFAFSLIDYGLYHHGDQKDRDGNIRRNDAGEAYKQWAKCEGRGCEHCKKGTVESKYGHNVHWAMSWGHYQTLLSADANIGKSCVTCGHQDVISSRAWICPDCGEAVIDMETTALKQTDVDQMTNREYSCQCGYSGFLSEIFQCRVCSGPGNMGKTPVRATLFDVDLYVQAVPTGKNNQTVLQVRWTAPHPIDQQFKDISKAKQLDKVFAPTSLEEQAKNFGVIAGSSPRQPRTASDISSQTQPQQQQYPQQQQMHAPQGYPQQPYQPPPPPMAPMGAPITQYPQQQQPWPQQQAPAANPWGNLIPPVQSSTTVKTQ